MDRVLGPVTVQARVDSRSSQKVFISLSYVMVDVYAIYAKKMSSRHKYYCLKTIAAYYNTRIFPLSSKKFDAATQMRPSVVTAAPVIR